MKGYVYLLIALLGGFLLYGAFNAVQDYGEEQFASGYSERAAEEAEAQRKLEVKLDKAMEENTALALNIKRKETRLEQARNETPKQVIRYVTKAQTDATCNVSRGNAWLLNAKAADCECDDVGRCSGLSIAEAGSPSSVTGSVHLQYSTRLAEYAAYAVARHNALVDAVLRVQQASGQACTRLPARALAQWQ